MIKVNFLFLQGSPVGGRSKYEREFLLFDDTILADDLDKKIKVFMNDNKNGYRKNISVTNIERI